MMPSVTYNPQMPEAAQALISSTPSTHTPERWSLINRVLVRLAFVYVILYCWPEAGRTSLLEAIPNFGIGAANEDDSLHVVKLAEAPFHAVSPWVAVHVFSSDRPRVEIPLHWQWRHYAGLCLGTLLRFDCRLRDTSLVYIRPSPS